MGQKTHPIGFRLFRNKNWRSIWYANKKEFGDLLGEDFMIRQYLTDPKKPYSIGLSQVIIKRAGNEILITMHTAKPGVVIGPKGATIEALKEDLRSLVQNHEKSANKESKKISVEVSEIKRHEMDAKIVADSIAKQLERRVAFRRVMKKAMEAAMSAGAAGIKIQISGRIGGAEIARTEWYKEGRVPLHTLRAKIDYAHGRAETTYGSIGVKVWINLGDEENVKKGA